MNEKNRPKLTQITDFKIGDKIQGFYLCLEKSFNISKVGKSYLNLVLSDNTGKVDCKIWENTDHFKDKFSKGDPVAVKGVIVEFMEQSQLNVSQINLAKSDIYEKYGFNPENLVEKITANPEIIFKDIISQFKKIKSTQLKTLCLNVFKKFKEEIISSPASLKNHYPLKGGLILHLKNCLSIGLNSIKNYKFLDKDLVIAGILLHDIGKIKCYTGEYIFSETDDSKLIGHEILGLNILNEEIEKIPNFPNGIKQKLAHIVVSHHKTETDGKRNWQRFPEALTIFNINRMDAQLDIMKRVINNSNDNIDGWTSGKHHFNTSLIIE